MEVSNSINRFDHLGSDLTQLILSHLPIQSLVRASSVCKFWRFIITSSSFSISSSKPCFFLFGQNDTLLENSKTFAFDPNSNQWMKIPTTLFPFPSSQLGSNGFFFSFSSSKSKSKFNFTPILKNSFQETSPLTFSRCSPLVGVYKDDSNKKLKFIIVGGSINTRDCLPVEIYDPHLDSWELCSLLPVYFKCGPSGSSSSQWLSSAIYRGKFYVLGIHSCFVSAFDLRTYLWSEVQTIRPPGVIYSFLVTCKKGLVLAGLCNGLRGMSFNLWRIDEETMEFSEMDIMPQGLLKLLIGGDDDDDDEFERLKCVADGDVIYVFNEGNQRKYRTCVCEIESESGDCRWRMILDLPVSTGNGFHKVVCFCSSVSLETIFSG